MARSVQREGVQRDMGAVAKLISKSTSVLLEDEGSKTSSKRHYETVLVLLKLICSLSIAGT